MGAEFRGRRAEILVVLGESHDEILSFKGRMPAKASAPSAPLMTWNYDSGFRREFSRNIAPAPAR